MTEVFDKENIVLTASSKHHIITKPSPLTSRSINQSNIQSIKTPSFDKPNAIQQLIRKPLTTMMSNGPPIHHSSNPTPISIRRPGLQSIFNRPMGSAQRVLQADEHVIDSDDEDEENNPASKTTTSNLTNVSGSLSGVIHANSNNHTANQSSMPSPQLSNQQLGAHLSSPNHQSKITSIKSPRRSLGTLPKSPRRSIGHTGTLSNISSSIHPSDHTLNRSLTEQHTDSHSSHSSSSDQTVMTPPSALPTISVDSASPASQSSDVDMNTSLSQSKSTPLSTSSSVNSSSPTVELDPVTHLPVPNKLTAVRQLQLPVHANRVSPPSTNISANQSNHLSASQLSLRSSPAKPVSTLSAHPSLPVVRPMHNMNNLMNHSNSNASQSPAPSVKPMQVGRSQMMKSTPQHSHHQLYNQTSTNMHSHTNNSVQTPTSQSNSSNNTPSFAQHNQHHNQNNNLSDHSSNNPHAIPPSNQSSGVYTVRGRQFRVLGPPLGKGGTSVVYRVVGMDSSNNTFALKVVRLPAEQQALIDLENEIKMLSKMKHVNQCIQLYDWDIVEKPSRVLYMVMELGKEDLSQWMQRTVKEPIDPIRLREVWRSMLQCVAVCHANGILHRDLKPANFVFVGIDVKLLDFGIAATMGEAEANETCVVSEHMTGTLNYMSPESLSQADRKYHQHRASDVWSLGCILYQLVYGVCPFAHISNVMGKMRAICDDNLPITFSAVDPHGRPVSRYLLDVMQGCLQRDPSKRANVQSLLKHPFVNIDAACSQQIWLEKSRLRTMLAKRGIHCEDKELDEMFEELR